MPVLAPHATRDPPVSGGDVFAAFLTTTTSGGGYLDSVRTGMSSFYRRGQPNQPKSEPTPKGVRAPANKQKGAPPGAPFAKKLTVPSDPLAQLCFLTVQNGRNDGHLRTRISFRHLRPALITRCASPGP